MYEIKDGVLCLILSMHGVSLRNAVSTPKEAVDITAKAGFKSIELPVSTWNINPETVTKKDITDIKNILKSGGVEASSLGMIWPAKYILVTSSTTEWKRNINYATKLFDFSAALGVKVLNLGAGRHVPLNVEYIEGLKTQVRFWKEACEHAENLGVIVAVEHTGRSHTSNVGNTTKELIDLVKAINSPSFQINAQIQSMAITDLDIPAAIRAMGSMIKLVHIGDVLGFNPIIDSVESMLPGKGKLDFIPILKALKDVGYNGEICLEPSPPTLGKDIISELRESRKFLEANWKQA